jgi:multimeric flavodoxin WrbA
MALLGVSGSPFPGGNTDRLVKAVLKISGKEYSFINLSGLRFDPCRGCCHLCATTNVCGLKDDLDPYLKLVLDSEALVLGTPYQLGRPTGFMDNFLTRLFAFHHVKKLLADKPVVIISVGIKEKDIQDGLKVFESMVTHSGQFDLLGHIYYCSMIAPCFKCGAGDYCKVGGLWKYIVEEDEEKLKEFKFGPHNFRKWEDDPEAVSEVEKYGRILAGL